MQKPNPDDYILATGRTTSVRHFVELAFQYVGIQIDWEGEGVNEKGLNRATGKLLVEVSPEFFRPSEVDFLLGSADKARKSLGWQPKTSVEKLVEIMMQADLNRLEKFL